jgi:hypothetical protein
MRSEKYTAGCIPGQTKQLIAVPKGISLLLTYLQYLYSYVLESAYTEIQII